MTHEQIILALVKLKPNAKWTLRGDSLEGLEWIDVEQLRPTDAEIINAIENGE